MADPPTMADGDTTGVEDAAAATSYFCHACSKEVAVAGTQDDMRCTECGNGFIEAIASLNPEYHRFATTRRRRRNVRTIVPGNNNSVPLNEALEHMYPHQMLYMVQMLLENARANRQAGGHHHGNLEAHHGNGEVQPGGVNTGLAQQESPELQESMQQAPENSEDAESDEGTLRLELEGFDLNDDEEAEWEEADEEEWGDGGIGQLLENALADANHRNINSSQDGLTDVRTARDNLTYYMRGLFQNLVDQSVEVRVELPDVYLGNPGDYLDSWEFEQLLQQLAENDNSRRGAPPAAKSAIDHLELVKIQQHHIDSGIAMCAICKELLVLDEPAKQLPCLHLYHQECILPWLSSRNSCPVCRYELPTDDPDYEEQKKSRRTESTTGENGSVATEEDQASDRGQNSGNSSVSASEETCREHEAESDDEAPDESEEGTCSEHSSNEEASDDSEAETVNSSGIIEEAQVELPTELPTQVELPTELPTQVELPTELPTQVELPTELPTPAPTTGLFKRKWLLFAVGPLVSIAGLVLFSSLGHLHLDNFQMFQSDNRYWWSSFL